MVKERMTPEQESARSERFTPEQDALLALIRSKASVPLEEVSDRLDDARSLIDAGHARLLVKQNVWGMEFLLCAALSSRASPP
jgi:hypothetical protein